MPQTVIRVDNGVTMYECKLCKRFVHAFSYHKELRVCKSCLAPWLEKVRIETMKKKKRR